MDNISIVIPYWNGRDVIDRLLSTLPKDIPVIIVDDHSDEALVLDRPNVRVIHPEKKGFFAGACNVGVNSVDTDVLILNQDARFDNDGWMDLIAKNRDEYVLIGEGVMNHPAWPNGYVQGTFMFIRRDAWNAVGEFNQKVYPLWGGTCEWQLRAYRAGYKVMPLKDIPGLVHRVRKARFGAAVGSALQRWPTRKWEFLRTPPEVSVIVPCYNYGHFLDDAINSLLGGPTCLGEWEPQTFQSFEIIIVDDASTDKATREKVLAYHDPSRGIRSVMLEKNKGTPGALNEGVRRAYGKYIFILSADDMCESGCLEKHWNHVRTKRDQVVYGDFQQFKDGERHKVLKLRQYDFDSMLYKNPMPACIMYRRSAWKVVGGYPERMVYGREDWAFNIALGIKGFCGFKMPGLSGYLIRREGKNRSRRTQGKEWRQRFLSQLASLYPGIYEGERPVGCCGGRGNARKAARRAASVPMAAKNLPGKAGLRLLEYVGGNTGSSTFFGPVTGQRYYFGGNAKDRVKYVDAQDYPEMVEMRKGRQRLFSIYVTPAPPPDLELEREEIERVHGDERKEIDATPRAIKLAEELQVDLDLVNGSGKDGRILVQDVREALSGQPV